MSNVIGALDESLEDCLCVGGKGYLVSPIPLAGNSGGICQDISDLSLPPEYICPTPPECPFSYCHTVPGCDMTRPLLELDESIDSCIAQGGKSYTCSDSILAGATGGICHNLCGAICGDPHIKTWNGSFVDYHGACDLVFLHAPELETGLGLTIHVRTTIRYQYSYISSAAVQIGDDVLQVDSWGQYYLDGIGSVSMPAQLGPFVVTYEAPNSKEHIFRIHISTIEKVTIKVFKDMVSLHIEGASFSRFGQSVGLLGNFSSGKLVGRDGVTTMDHDLNELGQEWQVRDTETMLFTSRREPQYPSKCVLPRVDTTGTTRSRRRLGETSFQRGAEKACSHLKGDSQAACVVDVMATGELDLASVGGY